MAHPKRQVFHKKHLNEVMAHCKNNFFKALPIIRKSLKKGKILGDSVKVWLVNIFKRLCVLLLQYGKSAPRKMKHWPAVIKTWLPPKTLALLDAN